MKPLDRILAASALAIILGAGLLGANWPSISGSTSPGVVLEDGAGNKLGVAGSPVVVQQITDAINTNYKVSSTQLDATSNVTLATVPNLVIPLAAGKTYSCRGHLFVTSAAAGGLQISLNAGGTGLTATSYRMGIIAYNATTLSVNTFAVALGIHMTSAAIFTDVYLEGAIVVGVAGSLTIQAAQSVSNAATTSIFTNSTFACPRTT